MPAETATAAPTWRPAASPWLIAASVMLATFYQELQRQATLLAYVDAFRLIALVCVLCIPLVLLFRRVGTTAGPVAAH